MNYRERMREYLKEPDEYSSQYGKWGALNREQRQMITRLLNEMDRADEYIKHQFFEIERLNKDNGAITKLFAKEREETKRLHSIIKEARELLNQDWYVVLRKGTITRVKQILDGDSNVS